MTLLLSTGLFIHNNAFDVADWRVHGYKNLQLSKNNKPVKNKGIFP